MIVDSSAIVAILFGEEEAPRFATAMKNADELVMAAPNFVETALVSEGRVGAEMGRRLDELIKGSGVQIIPFTAEHAALARDAWRRYGKGRHPAGLNLGDCFAYALAKETGQPLLFKGQDFAQTDIEPALKD